MVVAPVVASDVILLASKDNRLLLVLKTSIFKMFPDIKRDDQNDT